MKQKTTIIKMPKNSPPPATNDSEADVPSTADMSSKADDSIGEDSDNTPVTKGNLKQVLADSEMEKNLKYHIEGKSKKELTKLHQMISSKMKDMPDDEESGDNAPQPMATSAGY